MTDTMQVIDCDTHIVEPYDLWTSRVPARDRDKVLQVVWNEDRHQDVWFVPGHEPIFAGAQIAMAGWREYPPDRPPRLQDAARETWDVRPRLRYMDEVGVHAQVLYPNIAGFGAGNYMLIEDADLRLRSVQIYNDWLVEWTSADPSRFIMTCAVPFWDVEASVREIRRCQDMGHRGILFSSHPDWFGQPHIADSHWDPIWSLAQDLELSINFHIGSGGAGEVDTGYEPNGPRINYAILSSQLFMTNAAAIVHTIAGGVCQRFPNLQFVSVESGIGWIPFFVEAMDWQWKNTGLHKYQGDRLLPSEYFRRQFYSCFWFERGTIEHAIAALGADRILYETDFPHPTCQSPGPATEGRAASEYIADALKSVSDDDRRLILHDNAARLYHVEP
jgi:predicted TIM-barrel fold metal-dependent hydrolase